VNSSLRLGFRVVDILGRVLGGSSLLAGSQEIDILGSLVPDNSPLRLSSGIAIVGKALPVSSSCLANFCELSWVSSSCILAGSIPRPDI
jgi:hypothetical protein